MKRVNSDMARVDQTKPIRNFGKTHNPTSKPIGGRLGIGTYAHAFNRGTTFMRTGPGVLLNAMEALPGKGSATCATEARANSSKRVSFLALKKQT